MAVTKADHIGDPSNSAWGDFIAGTNKNFTAVPAEGVHPARCRTEKEYKRSISTAEVIALGDEMFAEDEWEELAERCGRAFGWREASRALYSKYSKMVKDK